MKTCCICGTGYKSKNEDILIYGCFKCKKGRLENRAITELLEETKSPYCPTSLRWELSKKFKIGYNSSIK